MRRECRERFPYHRLQRKPLITDPSMHHGTCVMHLPWCMSGSLTGGGGENVPGIPGVCATLNFTYLTKSLVVAVMSAVILALLVLLTPSDERHIPGVAVNNTLTLGYLVSWSPDWMIGRISASAITLGIREVGRRGLLPGYNIEWILRDTQCSSRTGMGRHCWQGW